MEFNGMLNSIGVAANETIKEEQGDYYGEDGLLYCHKCSTPKQCELEVHGVISKFKCLCKCEAERRERVENERMREKWEKRIAEKRRMGFADRNLLNCTFENDDRENEWLSEIGHDYVDNFEKMKEDGKGLLLFGNVGTGKSFIASAIANALIDKGYNCLVTNFSRLANTIYGLYDKQEYIDSLKNFSLLVIDDLAVERDTEYMREIVENIIDNRYMAGLPLIVTTNLTAEQLKYPTDLRRKRMYSRLLEMCVPVEVKGKDRRLKNFKQSYEYYRHLLGIDFKEDDRRKPHTSYDLDEYTKNALKNPMIYRDEENQQL